MKIRTKILTGALACVNKILHYSALSASAYCHTWGFTMERWVEKKDFWLCIYWEQQNGNSTLARREKKKNKQQAAFVCSGNILLSVDWVLVYWHAQFHSSQRGCEALQRQSQQHNILDVKQGVSGAGRAVQSRGIFRRVGPFPFSARQRRVRHALRGKGARLERKGHSWGNGCSSGQPPALSTAGLPDHPACCCHHSVTHGLWQCWHPSLTPLIPLPLSSWGFTRVPKYPSLLTFWEYRPLPPDLPSRSINILGNSTTPNSLSSPCMLQPRNRFPSPPPPPKEGCDLVPWL